MIARVNSTCKQINDRSKALYTSLCLDSAAAVNMAAGASGQLLMLINLKTRASEIQ
jgi:hypothetical protein